MKSMLYFPGQDRNFSFLYWLLYYFITYPPILFYYIYFLLPPHLIIQVTNNVDTTMNQGHVTLQKYNWAVV